MKKADPHLDTSLLARLARDASGAPTLEPDQAVAFVRHHVEVERIRTGDYDAELWDLWLDHVRQAPAAAKNEDVLERVLAGLRAG